MPVSELQIIVRMVLAGLFGALVGFERERHDQPAGLRTHMILAIGAALAMTLSINLAVQFRPLAPNGDPARLAAQVVSGIGFLGAGAILRYGTSVRGLTTATSLWTTAMIGLATGAGYFLGAVAAMLLLLFTLVILDAVEERFIHAAVTRQVTLTAADSPQVALDFRRGLEQLGVRVVSTRVAKDLQAAQVTLTAAIKYPHGEDVEALAASLSSLPGALHFRID